MLNFDKTILIQNIDKLMNEAHMTQTDLGNVLGMSQPNVSRALNPDDKKCFTLEQVVGISKHFNISIDQLVGNHEVYNSSSPRSIASFFVDLLSNEIAASVDIKVKEHTYIEQPGWPPKTKYEYKENTYPAFYLSSYLQLPDNASIDDEMDWHSTMSQIGKYRSLVLIV